MVTFFCTIGAFASGWLTGWLIKQRMYSWAGLQAVGTIMLLAGAGAL